jgi:hypothetical protein
VEDRLDSNRLRPLDFRVLTQKWMDVQYVQKPRKIEQKSEQKVEHSGIEIVAKTGGLSGTQQAQSIYSEIRTEDNSEKKISYLSRNI